MNSSESRDGGQWAIHCLVLAIAVGFSPLCSAAKYPSKKQIGTVAASVAANTLAKDSESTKGRLLLALSLEFTPDNEEALVAKALLDRGRPVQTSGSRASELVLKDLIVQRAQYIRSHVGTISATKRAVALDQCFMLYRAASEIAPDNREVIIGLQWLKQRGFRRRLEDVLPIYRKLKPRPVPQIVAEEPIKRQESTGNSLVDVVTERRGVLPAEVEVQGFHFRAPAAKVYNVAAEDAAVQGTVVSVNTQPPQDINVLASAIGSVFCTAKDDTGTLLKSQQYEKTSYGPPKAAGSLDELTLILGMTSPQAKALKNLNFEYTVCRASEFDVVGFSVPPLKPDLRLCDMKNGVILEKIRYINGRCQVFLVVNIAEKMQSWREWPWKHCVQMKMLDAEGKMIAQPKLLSLGYRLRGKKMVALRPSFYAKIGDKKLSRIKVRYLTDGDYMKIPVTLNNVRLTR